MSKEAEDEARKFTLQLIKNPKSVKHIKKQLYDRTIDEICGKL